MNDVRAVVVEKLVPGGEGLVRLDNGEIGLISGALPEEQVEVAWGPSKKRVRRGRVLRVLQASATRVEPECPIASACGGCDWLHLEYSAQLEQKALLVREALTRTGRVRDIPQFRVVPSASVSHYRSRIRVHFEPGARIGFFAGESHRLVDVAECWIARPELNQALSTLRSLAARFPALTRDFAQAELRIDVPATRCLLRLFPREGARRPEQALMSALSEQFLLVASANSATSQRFHLEPELWLEAPADAFVQVNWGTNQELVRRVTEGARARGLRSFADLYAGVGNFSLALARAGLSGISVEGHPAASAAASRAAMAQGFTSVEVVCSDAAAWLSRAPRPFPHDWVLLDPPRAGARELVPELLQRKPSVIAYCACDPVTLARDLGQLVGGGYRLEALEAFDMFPGTHHVEVLAWLAG